VRQRSYGKAHQVPSEEKQRYGGKPEWRDDKGEQGAQSGPSEGPQGASAGGRKPEGKA
jgi:hypothetical protein